MTQITENTLHNRILVGNGASIALWSDFNYPSIFTKAITLEIGHPLTKTDQKLFAKLNNSTNFEQVLSSLSTAKLVNEALGLPIKPILNRYNSVQRALIETVSGIHIPWIQVPDQTLEYLHNELQNYSFVYSTNYDLIIYWAINHQSPTPFTDYFFGELFDLNNTEVWRKVTEVLYLHGGLHLYRLPTGQTLKRRATDDKNLLELFGEPYNDNAVPLLITEGDSDAKLSSIYRSDYLSFAYNKFLHHEGSLVIFGHSLGESDQHIVDAINGWNAQTLAISMLPDNPRNIRRKKAYLVTRFPDAEIYFFDASTHPLGSSAIRVK